ncbi:diaminopimelate epimerase [Flavobacteriales bacterium]|nr:diaminopimelate epimerase [Flavobacteriales bacterium]
MKLRFDKYQGTGNDFIITDNRNIHFDKNNIELIRHLCDRKFGIGSDGLILIENHAECDFNMVFFNPDGSQSFCGNGSRCAMAFAKELGLISDFAKFNSTDGYHEASINSNGLVNLKMHNVSNIEVSDTHHYMNTGSPHYNSFEKNIDRIDVIARAREIRYNQRFKEIGTNVNFIEQLSGAIKVRTYERGVENETLSCGTGVTACALSTALVNEISSGEIKVNTKGGDLSVSFTQTDTGFEDVWLIGPTKFVFTGEIEV